MKKPVIIGITGGSGSGKTSVTKALMSRFEGHITMIEQDSYYKDQSHLTFEDRLKTNYDHPMAFDNDFMVEQIVQLLNYETIEKPVYDFTVHTRSTEKVEVKPADVIIVEGLMVLEDANLRKYMDIKVYVDTDADLRIIRRILRDTNERARSVDSVIEQYISVVRPMHNQFIEPSKRYADIIIPEGGHNLVAIDLLASKIQNILAIE
ncbi:MAG: udk [Bacillales bacterium]|nr:udk [Bacillales bacterium]